MQISKEEVMHIAKLACLNISDDEIESYRNNLQEILDFAKTVDSVNTEGVGETIGTNENYNVFRVDGGKDENGIDYQDIAGLYRNTLNNSQVLGVNFK